MIGVAVVLSLVLWSGGSVAETLVPCSWLTDAATGSSGSAPTASSAFPRSDAFGPASIIDIDDALAPRVVYLNDAPHDTVWRQGGADDDVGAQTVTWERRDTIVIRDCVNLQLNGTVLVLAVPRLYSAIDGDPSGGLVQFVPPAAATNVSSFMFRYVVDVVVDRTDIVLGGFIILQRGAPAVNSSLTDRDWWSDRSGGGEAGPSVNATLQHLTVNVTVRSSAVRCVTAARVNGYLGVHALSFWANMSRVVVTVTASTVSAEGAATRRGATVMCFLPVSTLPVTTSPSKASQFLPFFILGGDVVVSRGTTLNVWLTAAVASLATSVAVLSAGDEVIRFGSWAYATMPGWELGRTATELEQISCRLFNCTIAVEYGSSVVVHTSFPESNAVNQAFNALVLSFSGTWLLNTTIVVRHDVLLNVTAYGDALVGYIRKAVRLSNSSLAISDGSELVIRATAHAKVLCTRDVLGVVSATFLIDNVAGVAIASTSGDAALGEIVICTLEDTRIAIHGVRGRLLVTSESGMVTVLSVSGYAAPSKLALVSLELIDCHDVVASAVGSRATMTLLRLAAIRANGAHLRVLRSQVNATSVWDSLVATCYVDSVANFTLWVSASSIFVNADSKALVVSGSHLAFATIVMVNSTLTFAPTDQWNNRAFCIFVVDVSHSTLVLSSSLVAVVAASRGVELLLLTTPTAGGLLQNVTVLMFQSELRSSSTSPTSMLTVTKMRMSSVRIVAMESQFRVSESTAHVSSVSWSNTIPVTIASINVVIDRTVNVSVFVTRCAFGVFVRSARGTTVDVLRIIAPTVTNPASFEPSLGWTVVDSSLDVGIAAFLPNNLPIDRVAVVVIDPMYETVPMIVTVCNVSVSVAVIHSGNTTASATTLPSSVAVMQLTGETSVTLCPPPANDTAAASSTRPCPSTDVNEFLLLGDGAEMIAQIPATTATSVPAHRRRRRYAWLASRVAVAALMLHSSDFENVSMTATESLSVAENEAVVAAARRLVRSAVLLLVVDTNSSSPTAMSLPPGVALLPKAACFDVDVPARGVYWSSKTSGPDLQAALAADMQLASVSDPMRSSDFADVFTHDNVTLLLRDIVVLCDGQNATTVRFPISPWGSEGLIPRVNFFDSNLPACHASAPGHIVAANVNIDGWRVAENQIDAGSINPILRESRWRSWAAPAQWNRLTFNATDSEVVIRGAAPATIPAVSANIEVAFEFESAGTVNMAQSSVRASCATRFTPAVVLEVLQRWNALRDEWTRESPTPSVTSTVTASPSGTSTTSDTPTVTDPGRSSVAPTASTSTSLDAIGATPLPPTTRFAGSAVVNGTPSDRPSVTTSQAPMSRPNGPASVAPGSAPRRQREKTATAAETALSVDSGGSCQYGRPSPVRARRWRSRRCRWGSRAPR